MKLKRISGSHAVHLTLIACMALASTGCGNNAEKEDATPTSETDSNDAGEANSDGNNGSTGDTNQTDGNTNNGNTDSGNTDNGQSGNQGSGDATCDRDGFTAVTQEAGGDGQGFFLYMAKTSESTPFDMLHIQLYQTAPYNGATAAGEYSVDGSNYADCGNCLLAFSGCNDANQPCEKTFFADLGSMNIAEMGTAGGQLRGTINATFREVTIDPQTYQSTPVQGGQTWCMNDLAFSATVGEGVPGQAPPPEATLPETTETTCVGLGNGNGITANIGDFTISNANGEEVSLHSLGCGQTSNKALWVLATSCWCGACPAKVEEVRARFNQDGASGLDMMIIVGEDDNGMPITPETCANYAEKYSPALPKDKVFCDPQWQTTFSKIFHYPGGDGSYYLPWEAVLRTSNMEYIYNNQREGNGDGASNITTLLAE